MIGAASLLLLLLVTGGTAAWIWTCRQDRERQAREQLVANNYNSKYDFLLMSFFLWSQ